MDTYKTLQEVGNKNAHDFGAQPQPSPGSVGEEPASLQEEGGWLVCHLDVEGGGIGEHLSIPLSSQLFLLDLSPAWYLSLKPPFNVFSVPLFLKAQRPGPS